MSEAARLLLYAPNVHVGGGAVLLRELLAALPPGLTVLAWLDERARARLSLPSQVQVVWVAPRAGSRFAAELSLHRQAQVGDQLLCFHGLPPLRRSRAHCAVFQQNRNYLGQVPLRQFAWRTRIRLWCEQQVSRRLRGHVQAYWVQTPSMAEALRAWWGPGAMPAVEVLGFAPALPTLAPAAEGFDFIYVADGEAHKNHEALIEAWSLLAREDCRPSLALTLGARDTGLRERIEARAAAEGLRIHCLDSMDREALLALYRACGALVFPSLGESYGLPLIEARQLGLPIVAAELDYVRDVCEPAQSFDPRSPRSIARAVQRQLGRAAAPAAPAAAADFWARLLGARRL